MPLVFLALAALFLWWAYARMVHDMQLWRAGDHTAGRAGWLVWHWCCVVAGNVMGLAWGLGLGH